MKVIAKRDDGALLVADGPAALIVSGDQVWVTSRGSALARGGWEPFSAPVPPAAAGKVGQLQQFRAELLSLDADIY